MNFKIGKTDINRNQWDKIFIYPNTKCIVYSMDGKYQDELAHMIEFSFINPEFRNYQIWPIVLKMDNISWEDQDSNQDGGWFEIKNLKGDEEEFRMKPANREATWRNFFEDKVFNEIRI